MRNLDERLRRFVDGDAPDLWPQIVERRSAITPGPGFAARAVAAVAALIFAASGFGLAVYMFREHATTGPSEDATLPSEVVPVVTAELPIGGDGGGSILFAEGSLWATASANDGTGTGTVLRLDPATNQVIAEIAVPAVPGWVVGGGGIASGGGAIWVTGSGTVGGGASGAVLQRIDPVSNELVDAIPLDARSGADVVVDATGVWVAAFSRDATAVLRLDPETLDVIATIPLPFHWVGQIEVVDGRILVFALARAHGVFTVIDPASNEIVSQAEAMTEYTPMGLAVWGASAWTEAGSGLVRIQAATGELIGDPVPVPLGVSGQGFATGEGGIWFVGYNPNDPDEAAERPVTLNRLDPLAERIDVSAEVPQARGFAMAAGGGAVWIYGDGTLTRVDLVPSSELSGEGARAPFVTPLVARFMQARIDGSGAEDYVATGDLDALEGSESGLPPLYSPAEMRYESFALEFVDVLGDAAYEVGVRMFGSRLEEGEEWRTEPLFEETLLVGPGIDASGTAQQLLITGRRGASVGATIPPSCAFPSVRPDSLPWLAPGESVPSPEVVDTYKRLNWFGPDGTAWDGSYISMRLLTNAPDVDGIAAPPLPDGTPGVLVEGDNGWSWDVFWRNSTRYCGAIALYVYLRPLSPDEARSETIELARSLREEPR